MPENIVVVDIPDDVGQIADDSEAIGRNAVRLALANLVNQLEEQASTLDNQVSALEDRQLEREVEELEEDQNDAIIEARKEQAQEIVDGQNLTTLEEAKKFAQNWIETALEYAQNADYWRERLNTHEPDPEASTFGRKKIDDPDLADEVILRLNRMANNPKNRGAIRKWYVDNNSWLNSIVGFIREGEFAGCGHITMTSDDEGAFTGFERVDRVMLDANQLRQKIDRTPTTLEEAVIALGRLLIQDDHREMVHGARSVAEVCADLHHSLGRHLRNEWGLWKDSLLARHFKEVHGIDHPDDMSHLIIETYCKQNIPTVWERLKEET